MKTIQSVLLFVFLFSLSGLYGQLKQVKYSVFFDVDQASLHKTSLQTLRQAADSLHGKELKKIMLLGHTDNDADSLYNMALSQRRIDAVKNELIKRGLNASLMTQRANGEDKPLTSNANELGKQKNRRVDVIIVYEMPKPKTEPDLPIKVAEKPKTPIPVSDSCGRDTVVTLPEGTQIQLNICDFQDYFACLEMKEVRNSEAAQTENMRTITTSGSPLMSCGMLSVNARPDSDCQVLFTHSFKPIKVRFPLVKPEGNPECRVCSRAETGFYTFKNGAWELMDRKKMKITTINGIDYLEMTLKTPMGKSNCDCGVPYKRIKIKAPPGYTLAQVDLTSDCPLYYDARSHAEGKKHKTKRFPIPCFMAGGNVEALLISPKGDSLRMSKRPLLDLYKIRMFPFCKSRKIIWLKKHKILLYRVYRIRRKDVVR